MVAQIEIQEQTLKTIAQELHDNIGQTLGLVQIMMNLMEVENQMSIEKLQHSQQILGKAIEDLRSLSKSFQADYILDRGLITAIKFEMNLLEKINIKTHLEIIGTSSELGSERELLLFRIFQEAINNTVKHANASSITIIMHFTLGTFLLDIQDNGAGFETGVTSNGNHSGSGLRNMRNRANLLGGDFFIESNIGRGTRIHINIPIQEL